MIEKEHYDLIAKKYGEFASWAIWAIAGDKPKSNIGDMRVFDLQYNHNLLEQLNPNVIMVGLNFSRSNGSFVFKSKSSSLNKSILCFSNALSVFNNKSQLDSEYQRIINENLKRI